MPADARKSFKLRVWRIYKATAYKSALYGVEFAPSVETNVYANSRDEVIKRFANYVKTEQKA